MGSLVATVAASKCAGHATISPRFKKLVLTGRQVLRMAAMYVVYHRLRASHCGVFALPLPVCSISSDVVHAPPWLHPMCAPACEERKNRITPPRQFLQASSLTITTHYLSREVDPNIFVNCSLNSLKLTRCVSKPCLVAHGSTLTLPVPCLPPSLGRLSSRAWTFRCEPVWHPFPVPFNEVSSVVTGGVS